MIRSKEQHEELMRQSRERNTKKKEKERNAKKKNKERNTKKKDTRSKKQLLEEIDRLNRIISLKNDKINKLEDKIKTYKPNKYDNIPFIEKNSGINHSIIINYHI